MNEELRPWQRELSEETKQWLALEFKRLEREFEYRYGKWDR